MKVIKEALLGKVSRLFKHGADAVQRFNTESYLQWLGEARRVGKADACPFAAGTGRLLVQQAYCGGTSPAQPRLRPGAPQQCCSPQPMLCRATSRAGPSQPCLEINRQSKKGETAILSGHRRGLAAACQWSGLYSSIAGQFKHFFLSGQTSLG